MANQHFFCAQTQYCRVAGGQIPCHGGTSTLDTLNQTAA